GHPYQWGQEDGFIRFGPYAGGNPYASGGMSVQRLSLDFSGLDTLSFTARRNLGHTSSTIQFAFIANGGGVAYYVDSDFFPEGEFSSYPVALYAYDCLSGMRLDALDNVTMCSLSRQGGLTDFRMVFADFRSTSAAALSAVP